MTIQAGSFLGRGRQPTIQAGSATGRARQAWNSSQRLARQEGARDQDQVRQAGQGECRRDTGKRQEKQEERDQHLPSVACGRSGTVAAA